MFEFFKRKAKVKVEKVEGNITAGLGYDPDLISQLSDEHQELLSIFGEMSEAAEKQNWSLTQSHLKTFATSLRGHLLTENVKLYVYLSRSFANDPETQTIALEFRKEMMHIGRAVNQFVTRYEVAEWNSEMKENFASELSGIGEVLVRRIEHEEQSLYPLYLPEEAYA
ncbi:hypothetical protein EOPP23_07900 [Endozoicomonas sp. OPT23]|uniref:hemerythrin domain-containing protein n=1 Tax=Endozoicomonas sp. OPT23 TaxID=2072845 RepID=UPI00129B680F|nr:hemerythrin domain-containing protein [Endozoicomonas sp. OPT23]MRI32906.1 hypothetical protein [Endozoicomonas sp. OPT23]